MRFAMCLLIASAAFGADLVRTWQGIPGVERTPQGRVFVSWFSGGTREPAPENSVLLAYGSGLQFNAPQVMAGPLNGSRAFDPTLWRDPTGRLWYIFNRGNRDTGLHGVYARICNQPDAEVPVWGEEFRIGFDEAPLAFRMNKPTVLSTGEWILPVTHAAARTYDWFAGPRQLQGVGISRDQGRTWTLHGSLEAPHWALENMVVELKDGRLWMLIRTGSGFLWQSHSQDRGQSWTPASQTTIPNPGSRFFLRRLRSGALLLLNHPRSKGRSHLTAQLSRDDGQTWTNGLLIDERTGVSYPDAVESDNGLITMVYDRDRRGTGEIHLVEFREADLDSGRVQLRHLVNKLDAWDPKAAADRVMSRLINVSGPEVKGAHDAEFVIVDGKAYIVSMANEVQPGEAADWPFVYCTLSVVSLNTMQVERRIPVAKGGQSFANENLPDGSCFVPRILRKSESTLRVFFASEAPRQREAQTWYLDFDLLGQRFSESIHRAKIETTAGIFDLQPRPYYDDAAAAQGFSRERKDFGLYFIDGFKTFDGKVYAVMNNFAAGQNALAVLNDKLDQFRIVGHFNSLGAEKLTEAAINRLPDGTWLAICRQDGGSANYMFASSPDGQRWTAPAYRSQIPNGSNSKPIFEKFRDLYYLGWQESTRVDGVSRSVFNIDVSPDGVTWQRRYRFESTKSFQYPSLHEYRGEVWLTATQGDHSPSRKERIVFGKLE